jgi:hypothetical protein
MTSSATDGHVTRPAAPTTGKAKPRLLTLEHPRNEVSAEASKQLPDFEHSDSVIRSGRWSAEEQAAFVAALNTYGKDWPRLHEAVPTRSDAQIRSHA